MKSDQKLLFIVPVQPVSPIAVIDQATRKMCGAFRQATWSDYAYGGVHICNCGAVSSSHDHYLPTGELTNSLCVHYLAHHRPEVPQQQIEKIEAFEIGEVEPTWSELHNPHPILPAYPEEVQQTLKDLDAQIDQVCQEYNRAVAEHDWERAIQLRAQTRGQENELESQKNRITREWRTRYLVEHFASVDDLWIKMRWGVTLIDGKAASPEIVKFLRTALESKELSITLSCRLGSGFDGFMKRLERYVAGNC